MIEILSIMVLQDFYNQFPSRELCIQHIENLRWGNVPSCPYCLSNHFTESKDGHRYHCNTCNTSYSVTVDTLFHKTKIDLQKWFYAIHLIVKDGEKITSRDLADKIKTTKDTSWRVINEIKKAILRQDELIQNIIKHEQQ